MEKDFNLSVNECVNQKQLKDLKVGDFFTLKNYGVNDVKESVVWIRGKYDKGSKSYSCCKFTDACHERFFKGNKRVFTDLFFLIIVDEDNLWKKNMIL